tara:strand:+ start:682 stop:975 length:294 start_codon:yes stop_codon:yes gene_type:complete
MSAKTEKYINEVVENIRKDREVTEELLQDAIKWLSKDESRHQQIGIVMAKYVETLQRSNEQLVKVVGMMSKNDKDVGLSSEEVKNIFDMISGDEDVG